MKTYVTTTPYDGLYNCLFMREDLTYRWVANINDYRNIREQDWSASDNTHEDVTGWLSLVEKNGMTYLGSFTNFDTFCTNNPELLI